mgnify:CR=1 FL=1
MKKDIFSIVLLVSLSFYAWRFLTEWIIQFQGFMYMMPQTINTYLGLSFGLFTTAQAAGVLLSAILVKLVGVNMPMYMWIQLIGMLLLGVLFYFVVKTITKHRFVAFSASLIYTVSYFGSYQMYTIDYTAHFLERASVNIIFLLLSFLFLHLFLEKERKKFYAISVICFFLGVLFSHFSMIFTAPYFFYPFFWHLFNKKSIVRGFAGGLVYVAISGFFLWLSSVGAEPILRGRTGDFFQFLLNFQTNRYPEGMLMQLVYWSQYPSVFKAILSGWSPMSFFNYETAAHLKLFIISVYSIAIFIIYKGLANKRSLLFTTIFGTASIFLLNIYLTRYDPFYSGGTDRYFYLPTYLLAIFWSLFLWVLLKNKNFGFKIIAIVILAGYYLINNYLIFFNFLHDDSNIRAQKAIFKHIVNTRSKQKPSTLVIGPYPELAGQYEAPFFTHYLGKGEVTYMVDTFNVTDWRTVATTSAHVIRLSYSINCGCVVEEKLK